MYLLVRYRLPASADCETVLFAQSNFNFDVFDLCSSEFYIMSRVILKAVVFP